MDSHTAGNALDHRANLTHHFWEHIGELQPLVADLKGIRNRHNNTCLEFRIGVRARTIEHKSSDFCAVLHFACRKDEPLGFKRKNNAFAVRDFERTDIANVGDGDIEESVFINVVEFPEEAEQRREYRVRALVRLEPFDFIQHTRSQIAKSAGRGFSKRLRIATDGEIQVSRVGERGLPRSEDGNRVDKMIQCTPEIMNGIAGEKRQSLKIGLFKNTDNERLLGELSVGLSGESIRFGVSPGHNCIFQVSDMLLGSTDLCPYAGEVDSAGHGITQGGDL